MFRTASPLGLRPRADKLTDASHFHALIDLETFRYLIEQLEISHELVQCFYECLLNSYFSMQSKREQWSLSNLISGDGAPVFSLFEYTSYSLYIRIVNAHICK